MTSRILCLCITFVFALSGCASNRDALAKARSSSTHVTFTCKVYVDERGIAKNAEIVKIEPSVPITDQAKRDLISVAVLNKTFTPNQKDGKPIAGYVMVPIALDF